MRSLSIITIFLISAFSAFSAVENPEAARPNVLFLCVDDMKDWVNCLSDPELVEGEEEPPSSSSEPSK